jgi:5-methylcytosine-specific restriction endonuclease McrA
LAIRWSYKKREDFANKNGRKCAHCGATDLVSKKNAKNTEVIYNIDHIIPQINGGSDEVDNLQLLCQPCNTSKSGRSDFEEHYIRKQEVEKMRDEFAKLSGLEEVYMDRMLQSFNYKDRHHLLMKLLKMY